MQVIPVGTRGAITAFMGKTRTVTSLGVELEAVLTGAPPAERDGMTEITAEMGVCEEVIGTTPNPPTNTDRSIRAATKTIRKEVGWREYDQNGDG